MAQLKDLLVNGSARVIGSLFANLSGNVLNFGICSTAAGTSAKTVTTGGTFELIEGSKVLVLFQNTDTSNAPTLDVNGTGAKSIKVNASDGVPKGFLTGQQYYWFAYDGSAWRIAGGGATQIAPIQYGGTNNDSFTANRPLFFNGTKIIGSTDNYINDTQLGINETSITSGMNFEVNGQSNFKDLITGTRLILTSTTDAAAASANAVALIVGSQTGQHLEIDNDEIMSKSNGTTVTTLNIQADGGYTYFGAGGVGINGTNTDYKLYVNGNTYFLNGKSYFGLGNADQKYFIDTANNDTTSGDAELRNVNFHTIGIRQAGTGEGISLNGGYNKIGFADFGIAHAETSDGGKYGDVQSDWATYFTIKQESKPQRGWIWRGDNAATVATMAASLSNRGVFTTRAIAANDTYIAFPQGGTISYRNDTQKGMLIIKLPQAKTDTMLRFDVEIYTSDGSQKNLATYHIGGYIQNNSTLWARTQAYSEGMGNLSNLTVRFGQTTDYAYVTIGETSTNWNFPKIVITNLIIGHDNATVEKWAYGWQLSILNSNPCTDIANTIKSPKNQPEYTGMNLFLGTQYMDEWSGDNQLIDLPQAYCRGKKISVGFTAAAADKDIKSSNTVLLESSTWYTLSFYAKANKNVTLSTILGTVAEAYNNNSVIVANAGTGQVQHQITNIWKRFWVVFKTTTTELEKAITVLKIPRGTGVSTDITDTTVTVCLPKLEKGLIPTDWSRNPADAIHLFGTSGDTSYLNSGGGYDSSYNNLILHGTSSPNGVSGIAFTSQIGNGASNIDAPSDRAFIQYHPHGITTSVAEGSEPSLGNSGENGRFVIGIGNETDDQLWLQVPDALGLKHQIGLHSYTIADTNNTNWTVWNNGTTAGPTLDINFAGVVKTSPAIPKASSSISGIVTTDAQTFGGDKTFTGHIYANANSSQDIGSSSKKFRNVYATTYYGALQHSVTFERNSVTQGSFDNTASVTYNFGSIVQDLTGAIAGVAPP